MALTPGNKKKEDIETMINIAKRASRRFHDKKQSLGSANLLEMFDKRLNLLIQEKGGDQMILPHETSVTDKYKCECPVCQRKTKVRPKVEVPVFSQIKKRSILVQEEIEKSFSDLLRVLILDKGSSVKALKFLIADTLIFQMREPQALIYNSKDKCLRVIKQKEKLGFLEILKLFQTRQLRKAQDGAGIFNENTITMREKIKKAIQKAKIESIDEIPYVSKERSSLSPSPTKKEKKVLEATVYKDIAICKHLDGSIQLINELDFSSLMMKKKVESIWTRFDYIQGYIKLKKEYPTFVKVDYDHERDCKTELYLKARNFIYYLTEERKPEIPGFDYSTEEDYFEEKLKRENIQKYCKYLNYKFVNYLDAYCSTRIKCMMTEYAWEDTDLVYLANASKIKVFGKSHANEYVLQEIQIVNEQERENAMENLESDRIYPNKEKEYMLWAFKEFYKEVKNEMEIDKAFEEPPLENPTSNQAFKQLNPETSFTLFDVMTDEKRFEEFKAWIKQRIKSSESFTGLVQSALKFTETKSSARSHNQAQPHRRIKSSAVQLEKSPTQVDCARAFLKKKKALDICGNGATRKNLELSEIQYGMSLHSGRRLVSNRTPKASQTLTSSLKEHLNIKSPSKQNKVFLKNERLKMKYSQNFSPRNASLFNQESLNKAGSLTSIIYLNPRAPNK